MSIDQLKVRIRDVDALVAISASWNFPTSLRRLNMQNHAVPLVGLTGFDGGNLREL